MILNNKIIFILSLVIPLSTYAGTHPLKDDQVSRYIWIKRDVNDIRINPLKTTLLRDIPRSAHSISDALIYVLKDTGYSLTENCKKSFDSINLANIHRQIRFLRVCDTLQMIVGEAYQLIIDPVNKKVDFKLKSVFKSWEDPSD